MCSNTSGNIYHVSKIWQRNTALQIILRFKLFSFSYIENIFTRVILRTFKEQYFAVWEILHPRVLFVQFIQAKISENLINSCCFPSNHYGYHHYPHLIASLSQVRNNCTYRRIGKCQNLSSDWTTKMIFLITSRWT